MSATLRYDLGVNAVAALIAVTVPQKLGERYHPQSGTLQAAEMNGPLRVFSGKVVRRWAGANRANPIAMMVTFVVKLPNQCSDAWQLILSCEKVWREVDKFWVVDERTDKVARQGCQRLAIKLRKSLGLPLLGFAEKDDVTFMDTIAANPGDLSTWQVYADWLEERDDVAMRKRGLTMRGWLGPKPVKTKHGIPLTARD